jgi:hypothetical protein
MREEGGTVAVRHWRNIFGAWSLFFLGEFKLTVEVQLGFEYRFFFSPWLLFLVNNAIVNSIYVMGALMFSLLI